MRVKGVIYQAGGRRRRGVVLIGRRRRIKERLWWWGRGLMAVAVGVALVLYLPVFFPQFWPEERKPAKSRFNTGEIRRLTEEEVFWIKIPRIGAVAKVIANVDPTNQEEYLKALKEGVAHAAGTFFPGMRGNITLFAHSTDSPVNVRRWNAVFYRLDELEIGDEVEVIFLGRHYVYRVTAKRVAPPSETEIFKKQPGEERLYLQTCTPRGTSLKRLIVMAEPEKSDF